MYSNLKVCIIGDGIHSKRIQSILHAKNIKFAIYKPKNKKKYTRQNLYELKRFNSFFITSPDHTHFNYITNLYKLGYIFCEKPPCTNKKQLSSLKKIRSKKIYYNFNYRFSALYQTLKNRKKYNLGKLIYGSIINGHALGLKKHYQKNFRSKKINSKKGIFEVVSIHFIDIINNIFGIKRIENIKLKNYSKYGNSYDNSYISLTTKENSIISIFSSWTSELLKKKIFIFTNGSIEENENHLIIRGPALNLDKNNFTSPAKIKKKINLSSKKLNNYSLRKSIEYFLKISSENKSFNKKEIKSSLVSNSFVL